MRAGQWRVAAGAGIILVLAALSTRLLPAYVRNLQFQNGLEKIVQRAAASDRPDLMLLADVLNEASRLELPVRSEDVRVKRAQNRIEIEVLYVVPISLPLYVVDLHVRPRARVP
jgi:hypothetical protein